MARLFQQVLRECHAALCFPSRLAEYCLFGEAAEVEVALQTKFLCFDFEKHAIHDSVRCLSQSGGMRGGVRDEDAKEQRLFSLPVESEAVHDADDVRAQGALRPLDSRPELCLID
jgi:hypothetical protein